MGLSGPIMILWVGYEYKLLDAYQEKITKGQEVQDLAGLAGLAGLAYGLNWDSQFSVKNPLNIFRTTSGFRDLPFLASRIHTLYDIWVYFEMRYPNNSWFIIILPI